MFVYLPMYLQRQLLCEQGCAYWLLVTSSLLPEIMSNFCHGISHTLVKAELSGIGTLKPCACQYVVGTLLSSDCLDAHGTLDLELCASFVCPVVFFNSLRALFRRKQLVKLILSSRGVLITPVKVFAHNQLFLFAMKIPHTHPHTYTHNL